MTDTVDLSAVQAAPDPESKLLEPGTYPVTIIDAKKKTAGTGTEYINITAAISSGPERDRVVWDKWWLSAGAKKILTERFAAVGLDLAALPPSFAYKSLEGLHGIVVTYHEDYETYDVGLKRNVTKTASRVRRWYPDPSRPNDGSAPQTPAPQDPLAPAAPAPTDDVPF